MTTCMPANHRSSFIKPNQVRFTTAGDIVGTVVDFVQVEESNSCSSTVMQPTYSPRSMVSQLVPYDHEDHLVASFRLLIRLAREEISVWNN